jgi:hypothetical protein
MSAVPQVSVDFFCTSVLSDVNVDEIMEDLTKGGWLPGYRWKGFAQDPKDTSVKEQTVFGPLESVIRAIMQAAKMTGSNSDAPRTRCKCSGDKVPLEARIDSSRPDGWLRLESSKVPNASSQSDDHWEDICCPF